MGKFYHDRQVACKPAPHPGDRRGSPLLHLLAESLGYIEKLRALPLAARLSGPRIHDARIAALCPHHGASEL